MQVAAVTEVRINKAREIYRYVPSIGVVACVTLSQPGGCTWSFAVLPSHEHAQGERFLSVLAGSFHYCVLARH